MTQAVPLSTAVTHVLCCPRCPFMSLQSQVLASHAYHSHSLDQVPVYRCRLCLAASTQSDIMLEHAKVYHGGDSAVPSVQLMSKEVIRSPEAAPTGSRKRKSNIPERIPSEDLPKDYCSSPELSQPSIKRSHLIDLGDTPMKSMALPFGLPCGVLGVISNNYNFGCQAEAALDLSLKTSRHSASSRPQETQMPPPPPPQPSQSQELQQQQRQNFSSNQNDLLLRWFVEHRNRPYPGAEDTKTLAQATGLTYSQVKKWFANKRMRSKVTEPAASPELLDDTSMMSGRSEPRPENREPSASPTSFGNSRLSSLLPAPKSE